MCGREEGHKKTTRKKRQGSGRKQRKCRGEAIKPAAEASKILAEFITTRSKWVAEAKKGGTLAPGDETPVVASGHGYTLF